MIADWRMASAVLEISGGASNGGVQSTNACSIIVTSLSQSLMFSLR